MDLYTWWTLDICQSMTPKKGDQFCQQHVAPRAEFPEMSPSHLKNLCFRLINNGR